MKNWRKVSPEERERIVAVFNEMDPTIPDRYAQLAREFGRSTSAVFTIIKKSQHQEPKIKYFDPKEIQF